MSFNDYKDPIISQWHMSGGEKYSKIITNESHIVASSMFSLVGLPDISDRVTINGHIEIGLTDEITSTNQFKVDYTNGYVFVHSSKEGRSINVTRYASRGVNYYPASRIYTKIDNFGNVIGSLEDVIGELDSISGTVQSLDRTIASANSINKTLSDRPSGTIQTAKDIDVELKDSIFNSGTVDSKLKKTIVEGKAIDGLLDGKPNGTIRRALQSNIDLTVAQKSADARQVALDKSVVKSDNNINTITSSIVRSEASTVVLNQSTENANEINDKLSNLEDGTIKQAKEIDNKLIATTVIADESNNILEGNVETSQVNITQMVDIMKDTVLIYKTAVEKYSDIATIHKNPKSGWFVNTLDTQKWYRYDGVKWVHISTFDGTDFDAVFNYAKYIWLEEISASKGALSFTLKNKVGELDELVIKDTKYQANWLEGIHWDRVGQTVSFKELGGLPEALTFRVRDIGKDLKLEVDDSKTVITEYTNIKKSELNSHNATKKTELDSYRDVKKSQLDTHTTSKESQLNAHTTLKEGQLDTYTTTKESQLNNHTDVKKGQLQSTIDDSVVKDTKLNETIVKSDTSKGKLDISVADSLVKQQSLDDSRLVAEASNITLDKSIDDANIVEDKLSNVDSGSIKTATDIDTELKSTTTTANETDAILKGTVENGQVNIGKVVDIMNNNTLLYKTAVSTFSKLATTYPNAEQGFFVNTLDTKMWYRFNGTSWIHISTFDGTDFDAIFNYAKFVWIEEISVDKNSLSFTLDSKVGSKDKLIVKDTTYQAEWLEGVHWNRVAQTISFTESGGLLEDLTFTVRNIGKDLKLEVDDSKTTLDDYTLEKMGELDGHNVTKKSSLDSHTSTKQTQLNSYTTTKETQLDNYTSTKESSLNGLISQASTKESDIGVAITNATQSKNKLDGSITTATTSNSKLDISIASANVSDGKLKTTTSSANLVRTNLDGSISQGTILKGELDGIIGDSDIAGLSGAVDRLQADIEKKANINIIEEKSILKSANSITLTTTPKLTDKISIVDKKYGIKWFKSTHWNISGKIITFTSPMIENLNFEITIMG